MIKIVPLKNYYPSSAPDYELENGVTLWGMNWNGEEYTTGTVGNGEKWVNNNVCYRPVYKEDENGDFTLLGFEEN